MLRIMGQSYGWDLGELWEVDEREQFLRCVEVWHAPRVATAGYLAVRRGVRAAPRGGSAGSGLESPPAGLDPDLSAERRRRSRRCLPSRC